MRIICDAPGQTCNRLWTYVGSVAQCIAEKRHMVVLFFDWTIEDFPNLLHHPRVWFPLYHPWYLNRGNGWNNYKGLTWKLTHSKQWERIFRWTGCTKGWDTRRDIRYLQQTKQELQRIFEPRQEIVRRANDMMGQLHTEADIVIGVHIRRGDYATWQQGRFFFSLDEYHRFMLQAASIFEGRRVAFFISSNEPFDTSVFHGCCCQRFGNEPSAAILDLYTLSRCDYILGPVSTFSRWASFIGDVPLCFLESKDQTISHDSFSPIVDFFHFQNGREIEDW